MAYYKTLEDASRELGFTPRGFEKALYEPQEGEEEFKPALSPFQTAQSMGFVEPGVEGPQTMPSQVPQAPTIQQAAQPKEPLRYNTGEGWKEYTPGQTEDIGAPGQGTVSSPLARQTDEERARSQADYQQYLENAMSPEEIAESRMQIAKNKAYERAYGGDQFPEVMAKGGGKYSDPSGRPYYMKYKTLVDPEDNTVILMDPNTGEIKRTGMLPAGTPSSELTAQTGLRSAIEKLEGVQKIAGADESTTGPVDNLMNKLNETWLASVVPGETNKNAVTVRQNYRSALNFIAKARIGSAQTISEAERLEMEAADPSVPDDVFKVKAENFINNLKTELKNLEAARGGARTGAPASGASATPSTSAPSGVDYRSKYGY